MPFLVRVLLHSSKLVRFISGRRWVFFDATIFENDIPSSEEISNIEIYNFFVEKRSGCSENPCHNDGHCIETSSGNFECVCRSGFSGVTCAGTHQSFICLSMIRQKASSEAAITLSCLLCKYRLKSICYCGNFFLTTPNKVTRKSWNKETDHINFRFMGVKTIKLTFNFEG